MRLYFEVSKMVHVYDTDELTIVGERTKRASFVFELHR